MGLYFSNKELLTPPLYRAAYSDRMAWIMSEFSQLAYQENEGHLRSFLGEGNFKLIRVFQKDKFTAFLAVSDSYAVLAFRGTVLKDWSTVFADLDFALINVKHGKVDQGFYDAFEEISPQIQVELKKIEDLPLYITGHSLGGAMALLATYQLPYSDRFAACYTFGAPRVGNRKEALDCHQIPVYRCMHEVDIVPSLPLALMGYWQIGDVRFLTDKNEVISGSAAVAQRVLARSGELLKIWSWTRSISDHGIQNYVRILKAFAHQKNNSHPIHSN